MAIRGQNPTSWLARWRFGTCPIHGGGFLPVDDEGVVVECSREDCDLRAAQWPGKDENHSLFGWVQGPDEVHAALLKAGEIEDGTQKSGRYAKDVRTHWPMERE